jgi:DNA-binding transcriptional LysR family regulator
MKTALLGQVGDVDLRLLRVFRAVVECGGFAAAELELNIGLSTVSRHIKDLEARLGLALCRRGRAGFALTQEGQQVYEASLRVLAALEAFRGEVSELHADMTGTLALGLLDKTVTNPRAHIGDAVYAFRQSAPAVALELTVGTLTQIEAAVIDGRLQVGVVPEHRRSQVLEYQNLFRESMSLYCGDRHPLFGRSPASLRWRELRRHGCAALDFHSPNMEAMQRFRLQRAATVNDQEAVATLISSGGYLGFLPNHYAESFVRAGQMERITQPACEYVVQFVAIRQRTVARPRAAGLFWALLAEAHIKAGSGA